MAEVIYTHTITDADGNEVSKRAIRGNEDFTMVYDKHWKTIRTISKQKPAALELFTLLVENMNHTNSVIISTETLAELLGCSRMNVSRHLKYLRENSFIEVMKSGTSNVYHINADLVWKSTADRKRYAVLNSAVVMSASEAADPSAIPETEYETQKVVRTK